MDSKTIEKASSEELIRALLRGQPSQADSQSDLQEMCAELGSRIDGTPKARKSPAKKSSAVKRSTTTAVSPTKANES